MGVYCMIFWLTYSCCIYLNIRQGCFPNSLSEKSEGGLWSPYNHEQYYICYVNWVNVNY